MIKKCEICGKEFYVRPSHAKKRRTCSVDCYRKIRSIFYSGENHYNWKGGIEKHNCGYRLTYNKTHPRSHRGKVLQHRLIMEQHLGRELKPTEIVHHINGDKFDNRIENLKIMTRAEHLNEHRKRR